MSITSVSGSNTTIPLTQAVRPVQELNREQREATSDAKPAQQQAQPKPIVNENGQTVGTLVNITA